MPKDSLLDLFIADISTAQQLLELLDAEHQALQARELTQLETLLADKLPLLDLLQQHASARSQILQQAGLSTDRQGLHEYASKHPEHEQLDANSEALSALLQQCQESNLRNGKLIRSNHQLVNGALSALRGNQTPGVYDNRGSASNIPRNRPLSQA